MLSLPRMQLGSLGGELKKKDGKFYVLCILSELKVKKKFFLTFLFSHSSFKPLQSTFRPITLLRQPLSRSPVTSTLPDLMGGHRAGQTDLSAVFAVCGHHLISDPLSPPGFCDTLIPFLRRVSRRGHFQPHFWIARIACYLVSHSHFCHYHLHPFSTQQPV